MASGSRTRDIASFVEEKYVSAHVRHSIENLRVRKHLTMKQSGSSWHKYRSTHVTSTDAHKILKGSTGVVDNLLMRKVYSIQPTQFHPFDILKYNLDQPKTLSAESSKAIKFGHDHEPHAAQIYAHYEKASLAKVGIIEHPIYRWLACSPDRIDVTNNKLVEIKCAYTRVLPAIQIPPAHWMQMQIAMACAGIHTCAYVECSMETATRRSSDNCADCVIFTRDVHYDPYWFDTNVKALYAFHCRLCDKLKRSPTIFQHKGTHPPESNILDTFQLNGKSTNCIKLNIDGTKPHDEMDTMLASLWTMPPSMMTDNYVPGVHMSDILEQDVPTPCTYLPPLQDISQDVLMDSCDNVRPFQDISAPEQEHFMPAQVDTQVDTLDSQDTEEPQRHHVRHHEVRNDHGLFTNLYGRRFE